MDIPHLLILQLTALGAVVTLYGLGAAVIGARAQVKEENRRINIAGRLSDWENAEMNARPKDAITLESSTAISDKYRKLHAYFRIPYPSRNEIQFLGAYEAARIASVLLKGATINLVIAGVGLVIGTAGAVWGTAIG